MRIKLFTFLALGVILLGSFYIYTYKLNDIPKGFYVDEATVAYNAYSILQTGKDEYGKSYPILFRLFGSYTPPGFIYLAVPFIYSLGEEPFTFRLISALSAVVSIFVFYVFIKKLKLYKLSLSYMLATIFYAITPWLVFNARLGYEVTLAFLVFNIGLYFMCVALSKPKNLLWGLPILSLSAYIAHTQRYLFGVFLLFYFLLFRKQILRSQNLRILVYALLITLVVQIPNLLVFSTPAFWAKATVLTDKSLYQISHNVLLQFLTYYSPKSLFYILPDIDLQHQLPELSVMYNWMVVPFLVGVYLLFKNGKKINFKFLTLIFITAVIPAALSGYFISIQRALPLLFPLVVVIGLGMDEIARRLPRIILLGIVILVFSYSLVILYKSYFILFPKEQALAWNYGYRQLAEYITTHADSHFTIDNTRNPRSYIELLYFLRYPPEMYQTEVASVYRQMYYQAPPTVDEYHFGNVEVRRLDWAKDSCARQIIVGDNLSVSESQIKEHNLAEIDRIDDMDGNTIFRLFKTNPAKDCLIQ